MLRIGCDFQISFIALRKGCGREVIPDFFDGYFLEWVCFLILEFPVYFYGKGWRDFYERIKLKGMIYLKIKV